jgi:hypothetical protein
MSRGLGRETFTDTTSPGQVHGGYLVILLAISQFLRRAVMKTAHWPYWLIASRALSGVIFSGIKNRAEVPGLRMSRT